MKKMKKNMKKIVVILATTLILTGCTTAKNGKDITEKTSEKTIENGIEKVIEEITENDTEIEEQELQEDIDPIEAIDLTLKPNESGKVMVIMYHNIGEKESDWVRTPENFKKDLETLYEKGYRFISLEDFVNNNIDIEAGYTPVVMTFDDGNQNNFNIIEKDGEKIIDPNCAVGILDEFRREHPDSKLTSTFFVFGSNPFRQPELIEYKLKYLVENGYDVGNHTVGHENLTKLKPEGLQKSIGGNVIFLEKFLGDYGINTLALPYGSRPDKEYYSFLEKGIFEGKEYENIAILNVGWDPSVSPIDKKFNPYSIHRVRASETNVDGVGIYDWLSYFDKHPERRYISDGNVDVVTVPKKFEDKIDNEKVKEKQVYIYED